eukprot:1156018-Pelagomonas_calceolata.AAC.5
MLQGILCKSSVTPSAMHVHLALLDNFMLAPYPITLTRHCFLNRGHPPFLCSTQGIIVTAYAMFLA